MAALLKFAPGVARAAQRAPAALATSTAVVAQRNMSQVAGVRQPPKGLLSSKPGQIGGMAAAAGTIGALYLSDALILHEETVVVVSFAGLIYTIYKTVGGSIAEALDARASGIFQSLRKGKEAERASLEQAIANEERFKGLDETVNLVYDVQQDVNDLSLEVSQRQAVHSAADVFIGRLNAISQLESKVRSAQQDLLVNELEQAVLAHFASQKEDALVKQAIDALGAVKI